MSKLIQIAESPISRTGNEVWDKTFNDCFWQNMSTVVWNHSCMFDGDIWVGKDEECSWCGGTEDIEGGEVVHHRIMGTLYGKFYK